MAERPVQEVKVVLPEEVMAEEEGSPDQLRRDQNDAEEHDTAAVDPRSELRPAHDVRGVAAALGAVGHRQALRDLGAALREGLRAALRDFFGGANRQALGAALQSTATICHAPYPPHRPHRLPCKPPPTYHPPSSPL